VSADGPSPTCHACRGPLTRDILSLGNQPISHRYLANASEDETRWPLRLGCCDLCGLVQIPEPIPAAALVPVVDWISYREPESHLAVLAEVVAELPDLPGQARVWGIGPHDLPLLRHLAKRGLTEHVVVDPRADLDIRDGREQVAALQERITPTRTRELARRRGSADVVVARYLLEHAHAVVAFVAALRELVRPGGYLVLEVPDCAPGLRQLDYSVIWEEHVLYFTASTSPDCSPTWAWPRSRS